VWGIDLLAIRRRQPAAQILEGNNTPPESVVEVSISKGSDDAETCLRYLGFDYPRRSIASGFHAT